MGPGEILVTLTAAKAAKLTQGGLERRDLELKGKIGQTPVLVLSG